MSTPTVPEALRVTPWVNAAQFDTERCDPLGLYATTYWLPLVCPTSFVLGQRLVILLNRHLGRGGELPLVLPSERLAAAIGVGRPSGRPDHEFKPEVFDRALRRLDYYRLVDRISEDGLVVRLRWPRLTDSLLRKLPAYFAEVEPEFWALDGGPVTQASPVF